MPGTLAVLFSPAEFEALRGRDLSGTTCVVFDVLRATSSIVTALNHGAKAIIPVLDIPEALQLKKQQPEALLAGERDGFRIGAALTGGIEFDLGNSPREFTRKRVAGKTIVMTTTNGTRALRACARARAIYAASFLNLSAIAEKLAREPAGDLILVCSGTFEEAAYEDALAAGALSDRLCERYPVANRADSTAIVLQLWNRERANLCNALGAGRNGRRLLGRPELADDVAACARADAINLVARMDPDGRVRMSPAAA